jgi:peptidoglycan/LPS O-acetylase OafA/YrhL
LSVTAGMPSGRCTLARALAGPRIRGLDFARAIAVLLVLVDHSGIYAIGGIALFDGGFGVEIFFVLSGFLITWMLLEEHEQSGRIDLVGFYRRRAARLLPVFYGYLLAGLLVLVLTGKPVPWAAVVSSAIYVINYYQALTGGAAHYLSHCWSLAVEEQFYLLWPLAFMVIAGRGGNAARRALVWLVLGVWALRIAYIAFGVVDAYLYRALETRMDQLACGCLVAVLLRRPVWRRFIERLHRPGVFAALLVLAMIASINLLRASVPMKYGVAYVLEPVLVAMSIPLLVLLASGRGSISWVLNSPPMVTIGQVSYGMYLFHPFVIHPVRHGVERMGGSHVLGSVVSIAVVFGCAYVSFRFFESPLRVLIRGQRKPKPLNPLPRAG